MLKIVANPNINTVVMAPENLLADIRNKLSPASHLICLVEKYFDGKKTAGEFEILHKEIKASIPAAQKSIEYVRKFKL